MFLERRKAGLEPGSFIAIRNEDRDERVAHLSSPFCEDHHPLISWMVPFTDVLRLQIYPLTDPFERREIVMVWISVEVGHELGLTAARMSQRFQIGFAVRVLEECREEPSFRTQHPAGAQQASNDGV